MPAGRDELSQRLRQLDSDAGSYASQFVDLVLHGAMELAASDIHLQPTPDGILVRVRLDGILHGLGCFSSGTASDVVSRLKVLADLPTYLTDLPQEGRIREEGFQRELRVATFPTVNGERAVVRLFSQSKKLQYPSELGLPEETERRLRSAIEETFGVVLIAGPAGSGKTTTAYACLRELSRPQRGLSIVTLEDPVEMHLEAISQSQIRDVQGFTMAVGLRSLLRQDPDAILVGEVRDHDTATTVLQAGLTGQLVLTTFHAGTACEAITRLIEMGMEPYSLRSSLLLVLCQRLLRRNCECAVPVHDDESFLGLPLDTASVPVGCEKCSGTGYQGRAVVAELLPLQAEGVRRLVVPHIDREALESAASAVGMESCWQQAVKMAAEGTTSPAEVRRVFGFQS